MSAHNLAGRTVRRWSVSSGRLFRAALATLLFFMLPFAADAYTLVLRSGRIVNVSDEFKVTAAAITYEASPGYRVTIRLSNVDIDATEKANGETAGSFAKRLKRAPQESAAAAAQARVPEAAKAGRVAGRKVITNKELEPLRLTREAQEDEYERTRLERGMPSREELQQRIEEHDRWLSEWAQRMREERIEAELESLNSEPLNLRAQLSELDFNSSHLGATYAPAYAPNYYPYFYTPPAHVINVFPYGHRRLYGRWKFGRHPHGRPWVYPSRTGRHFPQINRQFRGTRALRRATPTGRIAPRHLR